MRAASVVKRQSALPDCHCVGSTKRPIRSVQMLRIYDAPSLPPKDNRFMMFWALLASGQITMRKVDGWQTLESRGHSVRLGARGMVPRGHQVDRFLRASARRLPTWRQTRLHERKLNSSLRLLTRQAGPAYSASTTPLCWDAAPARARRRPRSAWPMTAFRRFRQGFHVPQERRNFAPVAVASICSDRASRRSCSH